MKILPTLVASLFVFSACTGNFGQLEGSFDDSSSSTEKADADALQIDVATEKVEGEATGSNRKTGYSIARGCSHKLKKPVETVNASLAWLADHQNPEGYWSPDAFRQDSIRLTDNPRGVAAQDTGNVDYVSGRSSDAGDRSTRLSNTAVALLTFLGESETHLRVKYRSTVRKAIDWLVSQQEADGCIGDPNSFDVFNGHALATMVLCEAYAMTNDAELKEPAQKGVDHIMLCQNRGSGWRYGAQPGESDTLQTFWNILALKSAAVASLNFDREAAYSGANAFLDSVTFTDNSGTKRIGFVAATPHQPAFSKTPGYGKLPFNEACALAIRLFTQKWKPESPEAQSMAAVVLAQLPEWYSEESGPWKVDYLHNYVTSLALFMVDGESWKTWKKAFLRPICLMSQRGWHPKDREAFAEEGERVKGAKVMRVRPENEGDLNYGPWLLEEHGSWDPIDAWGAYGGRVYATAMNELALAVYYRYEEVEKAKSGLQGK